MNRAGPDRSTLGDVMVAIRDVLAGANLTRTDARPAGIEVLIGERYLRQDGAPPRLVMVRRGGSSGAPLRVGDGNVARWAQSFSCYLWGAEADDDADRYDAQDALVDRIVNAIRTCVPGRAEIASVDLLDATNVVTFGEELQLSVTYTRSVPRDAAIWAVPRTPVPTLDPMRPQGDTGTTVSVSVAVSDGTRE